MIPKPELNFLGMALDAAGKFLCMFLMAIAIVLIVIWLAGGDLP
jgi:hypothetical protein